MTFSPKIKVTQLVSGRAWIQAQELCTVHALNHFTLQQPLFLTKIDVNSCI